MTEITFKQARAIVIEALRDHYREAFPTRELTTRTTGRDLGSSWAVFLALKSEDPAASVLIGAPVMIVAKADGELGARQIPPSFEILDAPLVRDEADAEGDDPEGAP